MSPSFGNQIASGGSIATNADVLQVASVTHTVNSSLSNLHIGIICGGVSGAPLLTVEVMTMQLGEIKPEGITIV